MVVANVSDSFDQDNDSGLNNLKSLLVLNECYPCVCTLRSRNYWVTGGGQIFFDEMRIEKRAWSSYSGKLSTVWSNILYRKWEGGSCVTIGQVHRPQAPQVPSTLILSGFIRAEVVSFPFESIGIICSSTWKGTYSIWRKNICCSRYDHIVFRFMFDCNGSSISILN